MTERVDSCLRSDGTPKSAYRTRERAQAWLDRQEAEGQNLKPYRCTKHGWHVGRVPGAKSYRRKRKGKW